MSGIDPRDLTFPMRTGARTVSECSTLSEDQLLNITALIQAFSVNALNVADRYVKMAGRNGITPQDIIYAMKYETFEFLNRENIEQQIGQIQQEIMEELMCNCECTCDCVVEDDCTCLCTCDFSSEDSDSSNIVPEDELDPFTEVPDGIDDMCDKVNEHSRYWENWTPQTDIERILKRAIEAAKLQDI